MSRTRSASSGRSYGRARILKAWGLPGPTFYEQRRPPLCLQPPARRGPKTRCSDDDLLAEIRRAIQESPFRGEGHRKVGARLRVRQVRTSLRRVLRLMRANHLPAPQRQPQPVEPKHHERTIVAERRRLRAGRLANGWRAGIAAGQRGGGGFRFAPADARRGQRAVGARKARATLARRVGRALGPDGPGGPRHFRLPHRSPASARSLPGPRHRRVWQPGKQRARPALVVAVPGPIAGPNDHHSRGAADSDRFAGSGAKGLIEPRGSGWVWTLPGQFPSESFHRRTVTVAADTAAAGPDGTSARHACCFLRPRRESFQDAFANGPQPFRPSAASACSWPPHSSHPGRRRAPARMAAPILAPAPKPVPRPALAAAPARALQNSAPDDLPAQSFTD